LGDTIDGKCKQNGTSNSAFQAILDVLLRCNNGGPQWHFLVGNHDLYNFSRSELYAKPQFVPVQQRARCSPDKLYYWCVEDRADPVSCVLCPVSCVQCPVFHTLTPFPLSFARSTSPHPDYHFVFLDPFEVSALGGVSSEAVASAEQTLLRKNPNIRTSGANWLLGLSEDDQRFVPYNGACSATQLAWLSQTLQDSLRQNQKVFVFCHCPLYAPCCRPSALCWNSEEVLQVLHSTGNVVGCLYGHDHDGGYACDAQGVHHILPPAGTCMCMFTCMVYVYVL